MVASGHALALWVHSHLVSLRVTAMVPAVPAARLVQGTEVYVAPRLRVGPSVPAAALKGSLSKPAAAGGTNGMTGSSMHQQQRQQQKQGAGPPPAASSKNGSSRDGSSLVQTVLRVQALSERAVSRLGASREATSTADLPARVQRVYISPTTLAKTGLAAGDWVRLTGRHSTSLAHFGCLVEVDLVALGHLGLTQAQCVAIGAPPCSHIRIQRLTQSQADLLVEAQQHRTAAAAAAAAAAAGTTAVNGRGKAPVAASNGEASSSGPPGCMEEEQQQQGKQDAAGEQQAAQDAVNDGGAADMLAAGWLQQPAEEALRHLLPVLATEPRSLLQSWGVPKPGGMLVSGPPGSGKSALAAVLGSVLLRHQECLTYTVVVSCRELTAEGTPQARAQLIPKARPAAACTCLVPESALSWAPAVPRCSSAGLPSHGSQADHADSRLLSGPPTPLGAPCPCRFKRRWTTCHPFSF